MNKLVVVLVALLSFSLPGFTTENPAESDSLQTADSASVIIRFPQDIGFPSENEETPEVLSQVFPTPDTILVMVEVTVGADGFVQNARVIKSVPFLEGRVLEAAWQWRFAKRPKGSEVVPMTLPFKFAVHSVRNI